MARNWYPENFFYAAVASSFLALILIEISIKFNDKHFRIQGLFFSVLAVITGLMPLLNPDELYFDHGFYFRTICEAIVIVSAYIVFVRSQKLAQSDGERDYINVFAAVFSSFTALTMILLFRQELIEVRPLLISVAWLAISIALFEVGVQIDNKVLRIQGLVISGLTFFFTLIYNFRFFDGLPQGHDLGPVSMRLLSVAICIGGFYYLHERLVKASQNQSKWVDSPYITDVLSWIASILLVLLVQREVNDQWPLWVGVAWVPVMAALFYFGALRKNIHFILQGLSVSGLIFLWVLLETIPSVYFRYAAGEINYQGILASLPIIAMFYTMSGFLFARQDITLGESIPRLKKYSTDAFSWAASILLIELITVLTNDVNSSLTTVFWMIAAIGFYETGRYIKYNALKSQGLLLGLAVFFRAFGVNIFDDFGYFLFMSERTASILFVCVGFYYLFWRLFKSEEKTELYISERHLGSTFTYLVPCLLVIMILLEMNPEVLIPALWALIVTLLLIAGIILRNGHFLYQALIVCLPIIAGVLFLVFPEHGDFYARLSAGSVIVSMFFGHLVMGYVSDNISEENSLTSKKLYGVLGHLFSIPAAIILFSYITLEFYQDLSRYLTVAWAVCGLFILVFGFSARDRILRFGGLGILTLCILKVFYDLWILDIERIYKVIALIGTGMILIFIGLIYSKYKEKIKRIIVD